jgi:hypothetical protein
LTRAAGSIPRRRRFLLALSLLRQTTYWAYDDDSDSFGPAEFVGFDDMSFARYEEAVNGRHTGASFDGFATRRAIESALGTSFYPDEQLRSKLKAWGNSLLGSDEEVEQAKWTFVRLSVHAIIGHWWQTPKGTTS